MSPLSRRIAAAATVLLSVAIICVLALRGMGVELAVGPLGSTAPPITTSPSPTPSTAGSAAPGPSQDAASVFAAIEQQVRTLRGLPAPSIGPPDVISRAQLEQELRDQFDREYPADRRAADNTMLRALGLLTAEQDVATLQLKLLSSQVIGFYDDTSKRMVVISDSGVGPEVKVTYAHEYTHALQDGAFGLGSLQLDAAGQDDRDLARLSLVEGDATTTMLLWAIDHMTPQELLGVSQTPVPDVTGVPAWMVQQLELPYTAGAQFVSRLYASGGWSAVDAAFRSPPDSTEQIIDYAKYASGEKPVDVAAPSLAAALGAGWTETPADTWGEAMTAIWLQALGETPDDAGSAAEGWGGDRIVAASGPAGALAVAIRFAWDTPGDATQFAGFYRDAAKSLSLASAIVAVSDRETLVVQGSTQAIVDRAVAGLR
jgi:hypothetical protein